jgi:hypothetical protein
MFHDANSDRKVVFHGLNKFTTVNSKVLRRQCIYMEEEEEQNRAPLLVKKIMMLAQSSLPSSPPTTTIGYYTPRSSQWKWHKVYQRH